MKTLNGKVTISRVSGNESRVSGNEPRVEIEIVDSTSGCKILRASLSVKEFGYAVTGLGYRPAAIQYYDQSAIGKVREVSRIRLVDVNEESAGE